MPPVFAFLVMLGQWAQTHSTLVTVASCAIVVLLGGMRLAQRIAWSRRRP